MSQSKNTKPLKTFHVFTDGASRGNPGKAGAGIIIRDSSGVLVERSLFLGTTSNNVAEYQAFLLGLKEAMRLGGSVLFIYSDSELLVKQINGFYRVKDEKLKTLFHEAKKLLGSFTQCKITHISREENREADRLANEAIDREDELNRSVRSRIIV